MISQERPCLLGLFQELFIGRRVQFFYKLLVLVKLKCSSHLYFKECLNIFGSSKDTGSCTALKMCYDGHGSPLKLMYVITYGHL